MLASPSSQAKYRVGFNSNCEASNSISSSCLLPKGRSYNKPLFPDVISAARHQRTTTMQSCRISKLRTTTASN